MHRFCLMIDLKKISFKLKLPSTICSLLDFLLYTYFQCTCAGMIRYILVTNGLKICWSIRHQKRCRHRDTNLSWPLWMFSSGFVPFLATYKKMKDDGYLLKISKNSTIYCVFRQGPTFWVNGNWTFFEKIRTNPKSFTPLLRFS